MGCCCRGARRGGDLLRLLTLLLGFLLPACRTRMYTNHWAVRITGGLQEANRIASKYGYVNIGQVTLRRKATRCRAHRAGGRARRCGSYWGRLGGGSPSLLLSPPAGSHGGCCWAREGARHKTRRRTGRLGGSSRPHLGSLRVPGELVPLLAGWELAEEALGRGRRRRAG